MQKILLVFLSQCILGIKIKNYKIETSFVNTFPYPCMYVGNKITDYLIGIDKINRLKWSNTVFQCIWVFTNITKIQFLVLKFTFAKGIL